MAKRESGLPVLCKDFVIDPYQLHYAKMMNADAILLIVRLQNESGLSSLIKRATDLNLDCLVEVHDEGEVDIALKAGADIIGINNRNLADFSIDLGNSERLAKKIPDHVIKVSESGIFSRTEIDRLAASGFSCFLVGEALVTAADPAELIRLMRAG